MMQALKLAQVLQVLPKGAKVHSEHTLDVYAEDGKTWLGWIDLRTGRFYDKRDMEPQTNAS